MLTVGILFHCTKTFTVFSHQFEVKLLGMRSVIYSCKTAFTEAVIYQDIVLCSYSCYIFLGSGKPTHPTIFVHFWTLQVWSERAVSQHLNSKGPYGCDIDCINLSSLVHFVNSDPPIYLFGRVLLRFVFLLLLQLDIRTWEVGGSGEEREVKDVQVKSANTDQSNLKVICCPFL